MIDLPGNVKQKNIKSIFLKIEMGINDELLLKGIICPAVAII